MKPARLMPRGFAIFCLAFLFLPAVRAAGLGLIPQPRVVEQTGGAPFAVTSRTRIVVERAIAGEEAAGTEMLAKEVERWTGEKIKVTEARRLPSSSNIIYLGSILEDSRLRSALVSRGLAADPLGRQGYVLYADSHRVLIGARSAQGVFYGVQTLRQLLRPAAGSRLVCPGVSIQDWPAMEWRGVHVDLSRGPILTLDSMKRQILTLAGYKINLYALYMEHVFAFAGQPLIAPAGAALTPDEVRALVEYARRYFITILPEQETFGHLHNLLRYELYDNLAEIPHGAVLTPVQAGTYRLLGKMIGEMAPLFPGPFFHIGADETFELGEGQTKQLVAAKGLGQVYLDHIKQLDGMLKPYHKRVMFWADIAENYPQLLGTLPKDLIPVVWAYDPAPSYAALLEPFRKAGFQIFVSPSVRNWSRIYPDFDSAFLNIRNLARDGQKAGALGLLNTEWNDGGEGLVGMDWPGLVFGAACAWQPGESSIPDFQEKYDWAFYRDTDHAFAGALASLASANGLFSRVKLDSSFDSYFWVDPFSRAGASFTATAGPVASELRLGAENAWAALVEKRGQARLHAGTLDDLVFAAQRLDALGMKIQFTGEINNLYWDAYRNMSDANRVARNLARIGGTNGRLEDLRDSTTELRHRYAELWGKENRRYWLGNVLVRYDNLAALYQSKIQAIEAIQEELAGGGPLPPPENLGFFLPPKPQPAGH